MLLYVVVTCYEHFFVARSRLLPICRTTPQNAAKCRKTLQISQIGDKSLWDQIFGGAKKKQKTCFQGGKGAVAPQFWSTINFNRPEKGAGFQRKGISLPRHLSLPRKCTRFYDRLGLKRQDGWIGYLTMAQTFFCSTSYHRPTTAPRHH